MEEDFDLIIFEDAYLFEVFRIGEWKVIPYVSMHYGRFFVTDFRDKG